MVEWYSIAHGCHMWRPVACARVLATLPHRVPLLSTTAAVYRCCLPLLCTAAVYRCFLPLLSTAAVYSTTVPTTSGSLRLSPLPPMGQWIPRMLGIDLDANNLKSVDGQDVIHCFFVAANAISPDRITLKVRPCHILVLLCAQH